MASLIGHDHRVRRYAGSKKEEKIRIFIHNKMYRIATGGEDRCRHADTFYYKYVVKTFVIQAFPVPVQLGKGIVRFF